MISARAFADKHYAVFGLARTGLSVVAALRAAGAAVTVWDDDARKRAAIADTQVHVADLNTADLSAFDGIVVSPGVPLNTHPLAARAAAAGVAVLGDIELFAHARAELPPHKVVGITGTNGKSTTTALIGHILKEAGLAAIVGGNIGAPALALAELAPGNVYVLELSSFQLDLVRSLRVNIAVLLNLSPDHLDRHGGMAGYIAAKKRIFLNQTAEDTAIVGVDDEASQGVCAALSAAAVADVIPISAEGALGRGVFSLSGKLFYNLDGKTGEAGDISAISSLRGAHNWQNAAAALAAAMAAGVAPALAVKAMERYESLPHRMEVVARRGATIFVNDSKATNADAAARALKSYDNIYWIAGGRAKEGGIESLRELMGRVRGAYLIGEAAEAFEKQLAGAVPCVQCGDLERAVARACADAAQSRALSSVVLLSPACASYDQFRNFEERGEAFRKFAQAAARAGEAA